MKCSVQSCVFSSFWALTLLSSSFRCCLHAMLLQAQLPETPCNHRQSITFMRLHLCKALRPEPGQNTPWHLAKHLVPLGALPGMAERTAGSEESVCFDMPLYRDLSKLSETIQVQKSGGWDLRLKGRVLGRGIFKKLWPPRRPSTSRLATPSCKTGLGIREDSYCGLASCIAM